MSTESSATTNEHCVEGPRRRQTATWLSRIVRLMLGLLILAAGGGVSFYWLAHRPGVERRTPESEATLVETLRLRRSGHRVTVHAMGTVVPARSVQLASRVSGEITELSADFLPGGRFKAGETVAKIDPEDYELAVRRQEAEVSRLASVLEQHKSEIARLESEVVRTESDLRIELGQQSVAEREYELLGTTVKEEDLEFVLRRPQLNTAQANCEAAKAAKQAAEAASQAAEASLDAAEVALSQAKLDLDRTTIRAPFNAMLSSRSGDLGSQVSAGTPLAELVGTDEYWVEVAVPVDELRWLTIPRKAGEAGSEARVYYEAAWGPEACRVGRLLRLATELEPQGRMARLLISVPDPLSLAPGSSRQPSLVMRAYVRVEIDGEELDDVVRVPRSALRDGSRVWLMLLDNTLDIRNVAIVRSADDSVYARDGLDSGDLLVTSDIATPVQGMLLRQENGGAVDVSVIGAGGSRHAGATEGQP